jgi:Rrf2 family protein
MRISRSTGYGLLAVGYLAQHKDEGIILSQDISQKYNIPLEYLLKILQQLVRANILRSKRGPRGGFILARPPKKVTLLEVMEAVEGPMVGQLGLDEVAPREAFANRAEEVYGKTTEQIRTLFAKVKLSDLLEA